MNRKIEVRKRGGKIIIYAGEVSQTGDYKMLELTEVEAIVAATLIQEKVIKPVKA